MLEKYVDSSLFEFSIKFRAGILSPQLRFELLMHLVDNWGLVGESVTQSDDRFFAIDKLPKEIGNAKRVVSLTPDQIGAGFWKSRFDEWVVQRKKFADITDEFLSGRPDSSIIFRSLVSFDAQLKVSFPYEKFTHAYFMPTIVPVNPAGFPNLEIYAGAFRVVVKSKGNERPLFIVEFDDSQVQSEKRVCLASVSYSVAAVQEPKTRFTDAVAVGFKALEDQLTPPFEQFLQSLAG